MSKSSFERTNYTFEDEVFFGLRKQRTLLAWCAGGALASALLATIALVVVLPLKEIRPYVVMVDRATGESDQLVQSRPANLSEQEVVREAELVRYVSERETYDPRDNAVRIEEVHRSSRDQARRSLQTVWDKSSETYPPKKYGPYALITVRIRSVSMLPDDAAGHVAQVRFIRRLEGANTKAVERAFVATIGFRFDPRTERKLELVWENPLGFLVTNYRTDAETLTKGAGF